MSIENLKLVRQIKYSFLNEGKTTEQDKEKVAISSKDFVEQLKQLSQQNPELLKYKGIDLFDIVKYRIMGYDINFNIPVKVLTLEKSSFRKRLFLWLYWLRIFYYYKILNATEKRENTEINLIDYSEVAASAVKKEKSKEKIDVALICSDPSYFKTFLNLFDILNKKNQRFLLVLPLKAKKWGFDQRLAGYKSCKVVYIEDFFTADIKQELADDAEKYTGIFNASYRKLEKKASINGIKPLPFVRPAMKSVITRFMPQAIAYLKIAERIYETYQPKVLVGGKLRRQVENSFFQVAKHEGIKTISIMPVLMTTDINGYYDQGNLVLPDAIIAWDEQQEKLIRSRWKDFKVKEKEQPDLFIYGNPQWDSITASRPRKEVLQILGLKPDEKYIVITSQPMMQMKCIDDIIEIASKLKVKVVLKPHPREDIKRHQGLVKAGKIILVQDKDIDLYSLLSQAEITLTAWSNTCLESMILGTPSILYFRYMYADPSIKQGVEYFHSYGVPVIRNDKEKLKQMITDFLKHDKKDNIKSSIGKYKSINQQIANLIEAYRNS
jgi:hypothetical protein